MTLPTVAIRPQLTRTARANPFRGWPTEPIGSPLDRTAGGFRNLLGGFLSSVARRVPTFATRNRFHDSRDRCRYPSPNRCAFASPKSIHAWAPGIVGRDNNSRVVALTRHDDNISLPSTSAIAGLCGTLHKSCRLARDASKPSRCDSGMLADSNPFTTVAFQHRSD